MEWAAVVLTTDSETWTPLSDSCPQTLRAFYDEYNITDIDKITPAHIEKTYQQLWKKKLKDTEKLEAVFFLLVILVQTDKINDLAYQYANNVRNTLADKAPRFGVIEAAYLNSADMVNEFLNNKFPKIDFSSNSVSEQTLKEFYQKVFLEGDFSRDIPTSQALNNYFETFPKIDLADNSNPPRCRELDDFRINFPQADLNDPNFPQDLAREISKQNTTKRAVAVSQAIQICRVAIINQDHVFANTNAVEMLEGLNEKLEEPNSTYHGMHLQYNKKKHCGFDPVILSSFVVTVPDNPKTSTNATCAIL